MKNRGQALVEFIIVLPIFLLLVMSLVDFGNIIYKKYVLENDIDLLAKMYMNSDYGKMNSYVKDKNLEISYVTKNDLFTINIKKDVNIISPIVSLALGKKYEINTSKALYYE